MAIMYDFAITDAYREELLRLIRNEGKVQLVGSNSTDLIMLPRERYEEMVSFIESLESGMVREGLQDIADGKVLSADDVMGKLRSKYRL